MRFSRTIVGLVLALFVAISVPVELEARAGGGHSSGGRSGGSSGGSRSSGSSSRSSGSSSRSSGSSSGSRSYGGSRSSGSSSGTSYSGTSYGGTSSSSGAALGVLILVLVISGVILFGGLVKHAARTLQPSYVAPRPPRPDRLRQLRNHDPNFSAILFKAFAYLIYVKYQEWAGSRGQTKAVEPYLSEQVRAKGASGPAVAGVLVEALDIEGVFVTPEYSIVDVKFKATLMLAEKGPRARIMRDDGVRFIRSIKALTPAPEKVLRLGCPQCGSPEEPKANGQCPSCGATNARGEVSWIVADVIGETLNFEPEQLGQGGGAETGTHLPTRFDFDLNAGVRQLSMRDPTFSLPQFLHRVGYIFHEIQAGWSELNEARLRPYETDTVFDAHRYWLMHYRDQGVRNVLANVHIEKMQVAKIGRDAWFDAITVRIFASMIDYEVDAKGRVLCGNTRVPRRFSEYWTLVRRSDKQQRPPKRAPACPSCGAPLDKINQSGVCGYCNSHVTLGEFDWVLALIEQDETYEG